MKQFLAIVMVLCLSLGLFSVSTAEENINLKVLITSLNDAADGPFLEGVMKAFEANHPGVTIEPIPVAMNDLYTTLLTRATSNDLPDIFTMSDSIMANAQEMGMSANLYELFDQEWLDGVLPIAVKGCELNDELVFMPWQNNIIAVVYRKDLFEEKGLEIPETWTQFVEVAKALTEDLDGDGKIDRYGFVSMGTRNDSAESRFSNVVMSYGSDLVYEENGELKTGIGSDAFNQAMEFYINSGANDGICPPGFTETAYSEASTMIANNQACMIISASNVMGAVIKNNPDMDDKLGSFPLPHAEGLSYRTSFGTLGMSISASSQHKELCAEFLQFLTNVENSMEWNNVSKRLPCQKAALESIIEANPAYSGFADSSDFADLLTPFAGTAELRDICGECWQSVIAEGVALEDALNTAAKKAEKVMEKYAE